MTARIATSPRLAGTVSSRAETVDRRASAENAGARVSSRPASWVSPLGRWRWRPPTALRIGDAIVAVCVLAAVLVAGNLDHMPRGPEQFLAFRVSVKNVLLVAAFAWAWPRVLELCGLYAPSRLRTGDGELPRLLVAGAAGFLLALVFPLTTRSGVMTPLHALAFGVTIIPCAGFLRAAVRDVNRRPRAAKRHVVLVGSGPLTMRMYRQLQSDPLQKIVVLGFVDSQPHTAVADAGLTHLGVVEDLEEILMHCVVDDVFIGLPVKSRYEEILQSIVACGRVGVRASYSGDLFGGSARNLHPNGLAAPLLSLSHTPSAELLLVKRAMDVVGAVVLLVVLAPVMVAVALAVKLTSRGPVLFTRYRYGYMKRLFRMHKFRTMVADAEELHAELEVHNEASGPVFKIRRDPRVTRVGRFLRHTSLDELPQLWHVLTGHMSLVGPRPLATRDVSLFPEPWLMRRFSVRPGLTCLWQISGRSNLSFEQWIGLDLQYIDNWSLWLDLKILVRTLPAIVRGTGAM
jgi:exopolysaccharide biosynthesis polyprenyl glycosylphosphotransferase